MFENLSKGWTLGKEVWKIILNDKKLLVYPILSFFVSVVLVVLFFLILIAGQLAFNIANYGILAWLFLLIIYFIIYFVGTTSVVAMLLAYRGFVDGKRTGIIESVAQAEQYFLQLVEYSLFYATVLLVIQVVEAAIKDRRGAIGALVFGQVANLGISVATMFSIPAMIDYKSGPIDGMKRSTKFFIDYFGATSGGLIFTDLVSSVFMIGGFLLMIFSTFLIPGSSVTVSAVIASAPLAIIIFVIGLFLIIFGYLMNKVTSQTFRFTLYEYLNGKPLPAGIDKALLDQSIPNIQKRTGSEAQSTTVSQPVIKKTPIIFPLLALLLIIAFIGIEILASSVPHNPSTSILTSTISYISTTASSSTTISQNISEATTTIENYSAYNYTGVYNGSEVTLKWTDNENVEDYPDAVIVGTLSDFQTNEPNHLCMNGYSLSVYSAPAEYPGYLVVHGGGCSYITLLFKNS